MVHVRFVGLYHYVLALTDEGCFTVIRLKKLQLFKFSLHLWPT